MKIYSQRVVSVGHSGCVVLEHVGWVGACGYWLRLLGRKVAK